MIVLIIAHNLAKPINNTITMHIQKNYSLPYPLETVYKSWISSDTVIPPATRMDITPEVGGELILWVESPQFNACMRGVFKEIIHNKKLVYSWEWNSDGEITQVEVLFTENGDGCDISLSHSNWQKEESYQMHDTGWDSYIQGLIAFLKDKA